MAGSNYVAYNISQIRSDGEKAQARNNIGAASASDVTALRNDVDVLSNVSVYTAKGEATVAELNAGPAGIQAGWAYILTDAGTLTEGSLVVNIGDTVSWDGSNWFMLVNTIYYASKTVVDNISGSIASEYNQSKTGGYKAGEVVVVGGQLRRAKQDIPYNEVYNSAKWDRIKSTDYSFKTARTTCVTRGSVTQEDFYTFGIVQGMHVKVSTSGSSWTISTVPSGYAISVVQVFDEEGTILLDISSNDRPASFDFVVPAGGAYMRVRVRGDVDCKVSVVIENAGLSELYQMAGSKQGTDLFEAGNVSMSTSGNGYSDSTTRVRTKNGVNVRVCKGDYIESSDSTLRMYVNFLKDGESTWATKGWYEFKSGRYVFSDNGVAVLLFRLQPETTVSVASILDRLKIVSSCGGFSVGERLMRFINEKPIDFTDYVGRTEIVAATASTKYSAPIPVQGGSFVKVDFPATDVTGVSTSYLIRGVFLGSSDTTAYRREIKVNGVDTAPALTWILYIPQGVTSIRIGVRAAENVTVTLQRVGVVRIENPLFKSVAHRGSLFLAPPNTVPSFKISAAVGFRYCETDIRETSDGYLVCAHDDDISGVSNGSGNVSEMTLAQLQGYKFAKNYCAYFADTLIATYDDFLKCCKNCGMRPYIDIKVNGIESKLVAEAKENGILNESTFVSGDVSVLAAIRALAPNCRLGLLLGDISAQNVTDILTVSAKPDYSDVFFDCNYSSLTSTGIQRAKDAGIALECWTTGTLPDDYVTGLTFNGMTSLEYSVREAEFADVFEVKFG